MVRNQNETDREQEERHLISQMYTLQIQKSHIELSLSMVLDRLAEIQIPGEWEIELPEVEVTK